MTAIRNKGVLVSNYRAKISQNLSDCLDGLLIVFNNQRDDEIATNSTYHKNHIGFNKSDAKMLSQIAKDKLDGKNLSDYQIAEISRRMPKYARQIVNTKLHCGQLVKRNGSYILV